MKPNISQTTMFYGASPKIFEYAQELRANPTKAEQLLWERIKNNQLRLKFRRQHPIYKYIADFYCHKIKLVIEIDGKYHFEKQQQEYDNFRTEDLREFGVKVLRFNNEDVIDNIDFVITKIKNEILLIQDKK